MQNLIGLIVAVASYATPAFAARQPSVETPPPAEKQSLSLSSRLLLAQAQAPGRPLTEVEQRRIRAPQPPARDPLVRTVPPSPPVPPPARNPTSVSGVRD